MSDQSMSSEPLLPPPATTKRNPWKIVAIILGVLILVVVVLAIIGSSVGDNRDEKLAEKLPASIEKNFRDKGIDVTVESVDCEDLPKSDASFTLTCEVHIEGIDEVIETSVEGTVTDDFVEVEDVSSEKRLLTPEMAVEYVQGLVEARTAGITVLECELGGDVAVIETGSEFTCSLDSDETVVVTVGSDGSGEITDVFQGQ